MVAFSATLMLNSCDVIGQNRVRGNGHVSKEERQVSSFHRVKVEGSMNVYLAPGPAKAAVIEADDNIIPLVELKEEDGRLIVRLKRGYSISSSKELNVYLTTPEINEVSLSGSGDIKLTDKFTSTADVKMALSGSGNIRGEITAPAVKASISGSGDMDLKGETKDVNISIAGSGNFRGDNLMSENAEISIAGSGNVDVFASVKLNAKIAGSGDVNYKGTPQVSSSVAGSGTVQKK
jgi:hypothetical protein